MATFGNRPEDSVTDSRGNVRPGVVITVFATQSDATANRNALDFASTGADGRWPIDISGKSLVWAREPKGSVWPVTAAEATVADFTDQVNASQAAAQAAQAAAESAASDAANAASLVNAPADAAMAAVVSNPASATAVSLGSTFAPVSLVADVATKVDKSKGDPAPTLAPLYIETLSTGLVDTTPANLTATLTLAGVTGTKGSKVLNCTDTSKVAGLGSAKFMAVLNSADGKNDFFVTVMSNNGSNQLTLRNALAADFTGTLSPKYDMAVGQHLSQNGTRAYVQHCVSATGLTGSRGGVLAGTFDLLPPKYNSLWTPNAALTAFGTVNSAAPVVQTGVFAQIAPLNVMGIDGMPLVPQQPVCGVLVGTHVAGHGAVATYYAGHKDVVVEFWTGTYRSGVTTASAQLTVTVTADGRTIYNKTHDAWLTRVQVPVHRADKIDIAVTNADGSIYYIYITQATIREAGVGSAASPARKIVTMGDSWFDYYSGYFAQVLAEKTGATVVNHALSGTTSDWALAWFDNYVLAEKPDEAWFHFFTNDDNQVQTTYVAPDGSTQPMWPAGLTAAQAKARWRDNIRELVARCQQAGIKPVVIMPGGTASSTQTQRHAEWAWALDVGAPTDWAATSAELADATAFINTVGKKTGASVRVGTSARRYANGPTAAATWTDPKGDALAAVQKQILHLSAYAVTTTVVIGTDTNADGLSDGLAFAQYGTVTGDTYTASIVSGNQRYVTAFAASGATGNKPLLAQFTAVAGKEYLVAWDIINATPSSVMGEAYSNINGANTAYTTNGSNTVDASGNGVVCYRATAATSGTKDVKVGQARSNGNTRTLDVRRFIVVDVAALLAAAPNMADATPVELSQFALGLLP